jgi:serine/threonine protein kinase
MGGVYEVQPPPPSSLRPDIGSELDHIVMKLLRKDAAHRYLRAEELLADLANCETASGERAEVAAESSIPRIAVPTSKSLARPPPTAFSRPD